MRRSNIAGSLFFFTLLCGFSTFSLHIPHAQAAGQFSITVPAESLSGPLGESSYVSTEGQHQPKINILPHFTQSQPSDAMGFDSINLYINDSKKTHWDGTSDKTTFDPSSYTWDLCAGNGTNARGTYIIRLEGVGSGVVQTQSVASHTINVGGTYVCDNGVPNDNHITLTATTQSDPTKISFSLTTDIPDNEFGNYTVQLYHITPNGGGDVQSVFTTAETILEWNSSGSAQGNHQFLARAITSKAGESNIESSTITVPVGTGGKIGNPVTNSGTNTNTSNTSSTGSAPAFSPLQFIVPNFSKFKDLNASEIFPAVRSVALQLVLLTLSTFAIIAFLYSGILYGFSFGDPAKAERAKKNFSYAIIGVVLTLLSVTLIGIISNLLRTIGK